MYERPHETLVVWKEAYQLCLQVYRYTKKFPSEEKFALTNQVRRAACSVPFNIAEGNQKHSIKERSRYCEIVKGSLEELHCQCRLARDLGYMTHEVFNAINDRVQRVSDLIIRFRDSSLQS